MGSCATVVLQSEEMQRPSNKCASFPWSFSVWVVLLYTLCWVFSLPVDSSACLWILTGRFSKTKQGQHVQLSLTTAGGGSAPYGPRLSLPNDKWIGTLLTYLSSRMSSSCNHVSASLLVSSMIKTDLLNGDNWIIDLSIQLKLNWMIPCCCFR